MFPESSYIKWYLRDQGLVLREAYRCCIKHSPGAPHIAWDVASDLATRVWTKVWSRRDNPEVIRYPRAWIKTITFRTCLDYFDRPEHCEFVACERDMNLETEVSGSTWSAGIDLRLDVKNFVSSADDKTALRKFIKSPST